ncbi:TPA: Ail/Lom family outer membrane beta-barrel protein [Escherichia coli]
MAIKGLEQAVENLSRISKTAVPGAAAMAITRWHEDSVRNRWFSVMAGPSVRVNEWFSAYAMAGVAYSRVSTFSGDYIRVTDNKGKTHDVLTGSDDGRHSNTSLAWGAGVQFNPTESVAIDVAYEGSGSGDWRTDGFIVGVGYKF